LSIVFILSTVALIRVGINRGFSPLTFENIIDVFTLRLSPVEGLSYGLYSAVVKLFIESDTSNLKLLMGYFSENPL